MFLQVGPLHTKHLRNRPRRPHRPRPDVGGNWGDRWLIIVDWWASQSFCRGGSRYNRMPQRQGLCKTLFSILSNQQPSDCRPRAGCVCVCMILSFDIALLLPAKRRKARKRTNPNPQPSDEFHVLRRFPKIRLILGAKSDWLEICICVYAAKNFTEPGCFRCVAAYTSLIALRRIRVS